MDQTAPTFVGAGAPIEYANPGQFRLTMKSYIAKRPGGDHELLDEGQVILFDGVPGPHMEPLDDRAKALKALAPQLATTALLGAGAERINLSDVTEDERAMERMGVVVAAAVAQALAAAGIGATAQRANVAAPPPPPPPVKR